MKGVLFTVAQEVIERLAGEAAWDAVLLGAGVDGAYTALGDYPDEELGKLVETAAATLEMSVDDVLKLLGEHGFAVLVSRHPWATEGHEDLFGFLASLDDVIHPEVLKLYPDAAAPSFESHLERPSVIVLRYRSGRALVSLAVGLVIGAAAHFGTPVASVDVDGEPTDARIRIELEPR